MTDECLNELQEMLNEIDERRQKVINEWKKLTKCLYVEGVQPKSKENLIGKKNADLVK